MVMSLMPSLSRVRSMALLTLREAMCEVGLRSPGKTNSLSPCHPSRGNHAMGAARPGSGDLDLVRPRFSCSC